YMQVVRYKTAKLFEAASQGGAIIAGADARQEEAAAAYGRHIGTAFQLVDDVLDYSGDAGSLGKNVGDDLREGKPTMPLIRALEGGAVARRRLVAGAMEAAEGDFEAVARAIHDTGALAYPRDIAVAEAEVARQAVDAFPVSAHRDSLLKF